MDGTVGGQLILSGRLDFLPRRVLMGGAAGLLPSHTTRVIREASRSLHRPLDDPI